MFFRSRSLTYGTIGSAIEYQLSWKVFMSMSGYGVLCCAPVFSAVLHTQSTLGTILGNVLDLYTLSRLGAVSYELTGIHEASLSFGKLANVQSAESTVNRTGQVALRLDF